MTGAGGWSGAAVLLIAGLFTLAGAGLGLVLGWTRWERGFAAGVRAGSWRMVRALSGAGLGSYGYLSMVAGGVVAAELQERGRAR